MHYDSDNFYKWYFKMLVRRFTKLLGRFSTAYPFPKVNVQAGQFPQQTKKKLKTIKLIKKEQLSQIPNVKQDNFKAFDKSASVTIQGVQYIDIQRANKAKADKQNPVLIKASQQALKSTHLQSAVSHLLASTYEFHKKSLQPRQFSPGEFYLQPDIPNPTTIIQLAHSRNYVREIANKRADEATTEFMQKECEELAKDNNLEIKVIQGEELVKERFNLMWNVGKASVYKPRMVNLTYRGDPDRKEITAFVGKGLCFDSGGLNIKVGSNMAGMHLDKSGACCVMAAIRSIARLKLKVNITASMGFAENSINENAYRPLDIITSRKGLTVENGNTDAEGRLVLADVMHWTQQTFRPKTMVELSTLTGAVVIALGSTAGVWSNKDSLADTLKKVGELAGDPLWHMPLTAQSQQLVVPSTADLTNSSGKPSGSSNQAAAFLSRFVQKDVDWAHIDIAGSAMSQNMSTGYGPRLLIKYAQYLSNLHKKANQSI